MNKKQIPWTWEQTDYHTAKEFCEKYHYSGTIPTANKYLFLFYENNEPVGIISFGAGANRNIGKPYGLEQNQVIELTRVAFKDHHNYLTTYIAQALKEIKKDNPEIKKVISYSDLRHSHEGTLYKAANFKFDAETKMSGIDMIKEMLKLNSLDDKLEIILRTFTN